MSILIPILTLPLRDAGIGIENLIISVHIRCLVKNSKSRLFNKRNYCCLSYARDTNDVLNRSTVLGNINCPRTSQTTILPRSVLFCKYVLVNLIILRLNIIHA